MSHLPMYAGLTHLAERLPFSVRLLRWVLWLGITVLVVGLGVYAYNGTLIRYLADDYCFSSVLRSEGFFLSQISWYLTTSSRITVMLVVGISELAGPGALRWLPLILLAFSAASLYLVLLGLVDFLPMRLEREYPLLMALLVVFFAALVAPNRLQSLFWRAGALTYTFPMALGLLGFAASLFYLRGSARKGITEWGPLTAGLAAFFAGACSETYAAVQTGFLLLVGAAGLITLRGRLRAAALLLTGGALLGSLLAMAAMILSPANQSRMAVMPPSPSLPRLLAMSLSFAWDYTRDSLAGQALANLALVLISMGLGFAAAAGLENRNPEAAQRAGLNWEKTVVGIAVIPLVSYLLVVCGMAPSAFGESAPPEARALMISRSALVAGTAAWGAFTGYALYWLGGAWRERLLWSGARRVLLILLLGLLWLYPLRAAWLGVEELPRQAAWAAAWDARDAQIRSMAAQGVREITVPALDSRSGVMELGEPDLWVNGCAASFYGVGSIRAEE